MRCAISTFTAVVLAITIAGCGDAPSGSDVTSNGTISETVATDAAYAPASSGDLESYHRSGRADDRAKTATLAEAPHAHREVAPRTSGEPAETQHAELAIQEPQLSAGTLTAGSIDDHAKYDEYRDYVSRTLQNLARPASPVLNIGRRVMIHVTNGQGEGIGDARISIRPANAEPQNSESTVYSTTTASDGRALFLSGRDLRSADSEFLLTVETPGSQQPLTRSVSLDQPDWNAVLDDSQQQLPTRLDLALVIDTTGSMQDELNYLKVEIDDIAAAVKQRFPNVEQRFALILYRDEGDEYVTRTFDFTGSLSEFRQKLSQQSAAGGGDYPEAMHLALEQAGRLSWQSQQTARVLFLVSDAPPHSRFANQTLSAIETLRTQNVKLFPVAASGVRDEAEWIMRSAAFLTMGRYLFLTDHSGVGNPHAKPKTPSYSVERLNALMVRMIASELAGREMLPNDIIATETNAGTQSQPLDQSVTQQQFAFPRDFPPSHTTEPRTGVGEEIAGWLYETIQLPAIRIMAALLAIALIWKLDTRRPCVTT